MLTVQFAVWALAVVGLFSLLGKVAALDQRRREVSADIDRVVANPMLVCLTGHAHANTVEAWDCDMERWAS